ncbi:hypothetical protein niasHS_013904 [Heterodera schachtii]|uniref:Protein kinase domain-containing protein n=1 Tax=Heterodera schachtii TaxID=97005 RepID=A0ABD2INJ1_HETSC
MYVKKMGEDETLKLIDYDGATFIPVGLFENPRKLANKVVPREFYVATPTYAAIEYYEENIMYKRPSMSELAWEKSRKYCWELATFTWACKETAEE